VRQIPLRNIKMNDKPNLDYRLAFIAIVTNAPAEGMTVKEMAPALSVKRTLDNAVNEDHVLLEEADWQYLSRRLQENRFPFASEEIADMVTSVVDAPQVNVAIAKGKAA
jgi:hypothetical protein